MSLRVFTAFLVLVLSLSSCLKNSEEFVPDKNFGNIDDLITLLKGNGSSIVLIEPQKENTIVAQNGSSIILPSNIFVNEKGLNVVNPVEINYDLSLSIKQSIQKNRDNTFANLRIKPLAFFDINLKSEGKNVEINGSSNGIELRIPLNDDQIKDMPVLYFWVNNAWNKEKLGETNSKLQTGQWLSSNGVETVKGIIINLKKTGELMIGTEYNEKQEDAALCIDLPDHLSKKNTIAFAINTETKKIDRLEYNGEFCNGNLKPESVINVICLTEQKGRYYLINEQFKLKIKNNYTLVPKEITLFELKNFLKQI